MQHRAVSLWAALVLVLAAAAPAPAFWPFPLGGKRVEKPLLRVRIPGEAVSAGERMAARVRSLADALAAAVNRDPLAAPSPDEGLVVTSFVDLKNLSRTSSFGRFLGEMLVGEMQRRGWRVVELRKSRAVTMAAGFGEYGLSRDPAAVRGRAAAAAMLTGTYTTAGDSLVVNARIVDNRSAAVVAAAAAVFPVDRAVAAMLADAAAPGPEPAGVLYLKKLM